MDIFGHLRVRAERIISEADTVEKLGGAFDRWPNHMGYLLGAIEEVIDD